MLAELKTRLKNLIQKQEIQQKRKALVNTELVSKRKGKQLYVLLELQTQEKVIY
jgi:hypothetical protein